MKRLATVLVALGSVTSVLASPALGRGPTAITVRGRGTAAPAFVSGLRDRAPSGTPAQAARAYLRAREARYHVAANDLRLVGVERFAGTTTVRFAQHYRGVPVFGAQYLVHFRGPNSSRTVSAVNGNYATGLSTSTVPRMTAAGARRLALASLEPIVGARVAGHGLMVLPEGQGELAYFFTVRGTRLGRPVKQEVLVGARSGGVVLSYNDIEQDTPMTVPAQTAHGVSVSLNVLQRTSDYVMIDRTQPMYASDGGVIETHDSGVDGTLDPTPTNLVRWSGSPSPPSAYTNDGSVDAHYNATQVAEWYSSHMGRNSIDDHGMSIISIANVAGLVNAYWDGREMVYGNTDPKHLYPFSASLDVSAHELTHGVTQFSVDPLLSLVYLNQSGAMNEAISDYFGNAVQDDVENIQPADTTWGQIGEGLCRTPTNPEFLTCPLRDMTDPNTTNNPATTSQYMGLLPEFDNGGVHENSTIYSSALWEMRTNLDNSEGQTGADLADRIVYGAYQYLTPTSDFVDGRNAVVQSATDLGVTAPEMSIVTNAFDDHGIVTGWDSNPANNDSTILVQNDIPTWSFGMDGPKLSGGRYVYTDMEDKSGFAVSTAHVYVANVDGTGSPIEVGDPGGANELDEGSPVISGSRTAWGHLYLDANGNPWSRIEGRTLSGEVQKLATQPFSFLGDPALAGTRLAWDRIAFTGRNPAENVYTRKIGGKIVQLSSSGGAVVPTTNGTWVAWLDFGRNFSSRPTIMARNMRTGKRFTIPMPFFAQPGAPTMNGSTLFWYEDANSDGTGDIMKWKLGSPTVTTLVSHKSPKAPIWFGITPPPVVAANAKAVSYTTEENYFLWLAFPPGSIDLHDVGRHIYEVPIGGGAPKLVTHNGGDQAYPTMTGSDQRVVWIDGSQGEDDIMTRATPAG
jgi:Zn-dependent metalloprotease